MLEKIEIKKDDPRFLNVDPEKGLSSEQVAIRKKQKLTNKTKKTITKSYGKILFDNFCNPFNFLLIAITVVMIWGQLEFTKFIFAFVLAANIIIGLYQDIHARRLLEKLRVLSDDRTGVIRDGKEEKVLVTDVVLSDIIVLKQGDQIPADAVLRKGHCSCDESLLTGESLSVNKGPGDPLYSGSFLTSGNCVAEVARIGGDSYAEKLRFTASSFSRPKSEIAQSVWDITVVCTLVALVYGIAFTLVAFLNHTVEVSAFNPMHPSAKGFISNLSGSMVAMLPTGMFLLTSVALTTGVIALARKDMLVQELYCIEVLARVDTICFDKTGTLTDGQMSVSEVICLNKSTEMEIKYAVSAILGATHDDNVTARAMREYFGDRNKANVLEAVPFDPRNKYSAATLADSGTYAVGAYGFVPAKREPEVELLLKSYEKKGMRCLVVAYSENEINNGVLPKDFIICGVLVLLDHIKPDAKDNIAWFQNSGVDVYVISGDNPITVSQIAQKCGVNNADHFVDMNGVKDDEIPELVAKCRVFGRVLPEQKELIIRALHEEGHKVAMTGDGVNDILALKVADCSIAMASGSSAAKSVAHLVCAKSDFSSLPDVVAQGRRVINNLQRTCSLFLSKTIFAMVISIAFFISLCCGGHGYPFTTSHMLVWEIFSIGLPSFFLALQPNAEPIKGSLMKNIFARAIPCGIAECLCVGIPFLFYAFAPSLLSYESWKYFDVTISLCIICFSVFSYVGLFRICMPMNKYRAIVFGASFAIGLSLFAVDYFTQYPDGEGRLFHFMWGGFSWTYPLMMFGSIALAIGGYFLITLLVRYIEKKKSKEASV